MQEKREDKNATNERIETRVMGRPVKPIDEEQVYKLAKKHWSYEEIGAFFNVSDDTIKRRFKDLVATARLEGNAYIKDLQWKRAMEGSDKMILHLSEQRLGETKKIEVKSDVTVATPPVEKILDITNQISSIVEEKVEWEKQRLLSPPKS